MANYVFAYSGGKGVSADEAERNAQYAKWGQWFNELDSVIVQGGAAMGIAKTVGPGGSVSDGGSRGLTGYSIVSADSLDAAVELAKGCPVLEIGGAVDVYEALAM
ncbi:MAG: hypothetical protein M3Y09_16550 [Actinomycetota bacterium]|nr:hypothetical protein [Actinomycetota bacterium]